jgi:hypothetical protein
MAARRKNWMVVEKKNAKRFLAVLFKEVLAQMTDAEAEKLQAAYQGTEPDPQQWPLMLALRPNPASPRMRKTEFSWAVTDQPWQPAHDPWSVDWLEEHVAKAEEPHV